MDTANSLNEIDVARLKPLRMTDADVLVQGHSDQWKTSQTTYIVDARRGIVEQAEPRRTKVALVGFASSTMGAAPFHDPEWEIWAMNQLYRHIPRWDRWFEMHTPAVYEADKVRDTDYVGWLQRCSVPVYQVQTEERIPNSVRFPIERAMAEFGRYFQSTIGYMIALAMMEGFTTIGLWGIDLVVGTEYDYQKANAEYLLGVAIGRGLRVMIPEESALLKQSYMYGYETGPQNRGPFDMKFLEERCAFLLERRNELITELNAIDGAYSETNSFREMLLLHSRGAKVMLNPRGDQKKG